MSQLFLYSILGLLESHCTKVIVVMLFFSITCDHKPPNEVNNWSFEPLLRLSFLSVIYLLRRADSGVWFVAQVFGKWTWSDLKEKIEVERFLFPLPAVALMLFQAPPSEGTNFGHGHCERSHATEAQVKNQWKKEELLFLSLMSFLLYRQENKSLFVKYLPRL